MSVLDPLPATEPREVLDRLEAEVLFAEARRRARRRRAGYAAAAVVLTFGAAVVMAGSPLDPFMAGSTWFTPAGEHPIGTSAQRNPAAAASGSQVAFEIHRGRHSELYAVNADGSGLHMLTELRPMFGGVGGGVWSPDGQQILFMTTRWGLRGGSEEVAVVNVDGTGERMLTDDFVSSDQAFAWSPDGQQIAFNRSSYRERRDPSRDGIYLMNADGSRLRRLGPGPGNDPVWSPDGEHILFGSHDVMWLANADGSGQRRIADGGSYLWSPDGQSIAYGRDRNQAVWVMNADGSDQRRLSSGAALADQPMQWSPDGSKILFQRVLAEEPRQPPKAADLYVIDADGSGEHLVARHVTGIDNCWSADGQRIIFTRGRASGIYSVNVDGTGERLLARGWHPARSPDGRQLAFSRDKAAWIMNTDGSAQRRLTPPMGGDDPSGFSWSPATERHAAG